MTTELTFECKRCLSPGGTFTLEVETDRRMCHVFDARILSRECDHDPVEMEDDGALLDMVRDENADLDDDLYESPSAQSESGYAGSWDAVVERVDAAMRDGFGRRL